MVTRAIKKIIRNRTNGCCWLCDEQGDDVAHVIPKSRSGRKLFRMYNEMGLHRMKTIHSHDNLIYLCKGCHTRFDETVPAWIFLPTNLNKFLEIEKQFQIERISAAQNGQHLDRTPPIHGPRCRYTRYQIREHLVHTDALKRAQTQRWAGSPIAAIVHSSAITGRHMRLDPVEKYGLPESVADILQQLLFLYGTAPPKIIETPEVLEESKIFKKPKLPEKPKVVEEPKVIIEKNNKRRHSDTDDEDDGASDNVSVYTSRTAQSHDTRISKNVPVKRARLTFVRETSADTVAEQPTHKLLSQGEKIRCDNGKVQVERWFKNGLGDKRVMYNWLGRPGNVGS